MNIFNKIDEWGKENARKADERKAQEAKLTEADKNTRSIKETLNCGCVVTVLIGTLILLGIALHFVGIL